MIFPDRFRSSPLRFLFYLNWILFSILFLSIFRFRYFPFNNLYWVNFFCLFAFALMGLKLSTLNKPLEKFIYVSGEFLLIGLTNWGGMRGYILLYLVLVVRNSFILSRSSRLVVTIGVFILIAIGQIYRMQNLGIRPGFLDFRLRIVSTMIVLFGLVLLFLQLLVDAVLAEHDSRKKLAIANEKLRQYAAKIEDMSTLQ